MGLLMPDFNSSEVEEASQHDVVLSSFGNRIMDLKKKKDEFSSWIWMAFLSKGSESNIVNNGQVLCLCDQNMMSFIGFALRHSILNSLS